MSYLQYEQAVPRPSRCANRRGPSHGGQLTKPSTNNGDDAVPPGFSIFFASASHGSFEALIGPLYCAPGVQSGQTRFGFRAAQHHANFYGVIHGGMLMSVADAMMGSLVFQALDGAPCASISVTCDFIASARVGQWVGGEASLVRMGRAVAFTETKLFADDKLLLTATGKWALLGPAKAV